VCVWGGCPFFSYTFQYSGQHKIIPNRVALLENVYNFTINVEQLVRNKSSIRFLKLSPTLYFLGNTEFGETRHIQHLTRAHLAYGASLCTCDNISCDPRSETPSLRLWQGRIVTEMQYSLAFYASQVSELNCECFCLLGVCLLSLSEWTAQ
jgi:hypothetical protein